MGDTLIEEHSIGPHNKDGDIYELTKDVHSKIINFDRSTISDSLKLLRIPFNNSEIDSYLNSIIVFGIKAFIYRLNRSDLLDICNLIKLGNNHQRHLSNHIFRNGINHFISNISDRDILINIRKRLYLEDDLNDSSDFSIEDIKKGIIDEIISIGFESLLNSLNISLLKRYCNELKIDDSGSKTEIVNRILDDVFNLLSSMEYSDILEHNKKKVRKTKKRKSQATSEDGISNKKSRVFDSSDSDDSSPNGKEKQKKRNSNGSDDDEDDGYVSYFNIIYNLYTEFSLINLENQEQE